MKYLYGTPIYNINQKTAAYDINRLPNKRISKRVHTRTGNDKNLNAA